MSLSGSKPCCYFNAKQHWPPVLDSQVPDGTKTNGMESSGIQAKSQWLPSGDVINVKVEAGVNDRWI